ncbi:LAMI_0H06282g1_1 [Lachancea mirantina]|uniref:LAMI_0H06282g1_1 n=1 Tax=Lachancea mirantina TaxID=1230905 RepID=A0A1G4KFJ1_9SACH|nr:LAMI_0H06282g1_1 [Lachancea mirantina]
MELSSKKRNSSFYLRKANSSILSMSEHDYELHSVQESSANFRHDIENQGIQTQSPSYSLWWKLKSWVKSRPKRIALAIIGLLACYACVEFLVLRREWNDWGVKPLRLTIGDSHVKRFSIEHVLNKEFAYQEFDWRFIRPSSRYKLQEEDPGLYLSVEAPNGISRYVAKQMVDNHFYFELSKTTFSYGGEEFEIEDLIPSYRLDKAILSTGHEKEYRHSSRAYYWLKDVTTNIYLPITPFPDEGALYKLSYAKFSPSYNFIYFVYENDLFVQQTEFGSTPQRLTTDGSHSVFNGKPDWVYEEEIFSSDEAVWWAEDDSKLVFAKFDDSDVQTFDYMSFSGNGPYNSQKQVKYPKPGTPNPSVKLFTLSMSEGVLYELQSQKQSHEKILYFGQWIGPNQFLFKESDRESKELTINLYDCDTAMVSPVRTVYSNTYNGWIEKQKKVMVIPPKESLGRKQFGYVDVETDSKGFLHLFYYPGGKSIEGHQLTHGDWEVTGNGIIGYEFETDTVFFLANERGSIFRHIYSVIAVTGDTSGVKVLQNPEEGSFNAFELSASCRFAIRQYLGPNIPVTTAGPLTLILSDDHSRSITPLTNSENLKTTLQKFDMPETSHHVIKLSDGVEILYTLIQPKGIDEERKHPLLVQVYGGPGSQTVTARFDVGLEESVSSGLDAIVLKIEPRGTGGRGWSFKRWVKGKIGYWEVNDLREVTKAVIKAKSHLIDENRIAIWGWSYGAFLALKTLEVDAGQIFKYGVAVAPVTNWKFYNSIYTERIMGKPDENDVGYSEHSLIKDVENFNKVKRFFLVHGTADDNVHLQNTLNLIDQFNLNSVTNYDWQIYPDSDHSIVFHNAGRIVYEKIYSWLMDAFSGQFDSQHF